MRAGNLDRLISIERPTTGLDMYGTPIQTWVLVANMYAQLIQNTAEQTDEGSGATTGKTLVFRMYWLDGVTTAYSVTYEGARYEIRETKELGRRQGLDLRCVKVGL